MNSILNISETIENDAYSHNCKCPRCNNRISRGYEERIFYCYNCGAKLHQRAFTEKEISDALFEHKMDGMKIYNL